MRLFGFALVVIGSVLASRDASAQGFWYVPPGYGDGYYYGLDFGGGVGYGYGAGIGVAVPPQVLMGSYTPPYIPPQDFGDVQQASWPASNYGSYSKPQAIKKAVATASPTKKKATQAHAKKKVGKVQHAKANS